jgi:TRAP-type uncharacterized transport system fused permease subunit
MIGFCLAPMNWAERVVFAVASLMLIDPGTLTAIIDIAMMAVGLFIQSRKSKSIKKTGGVH